MGVTVQRVAPAADAGSWHRPTADRLSLYSYLLAFGVITHHHPGSSTSVWDTPYVPVALAFAVGLLFRPGSMWLLLGLFGAVVADGVAEAPFYTNHFLLLALMAAIAIPLIVGPIRRHDRLGVQRRLFPVVAAGLVTSYLLACFQKLNSGFFDAALGCAMDQYRIFAETIDLPVPNGGPFGATVALGTVLVEAGIPLLLLRRRTRAAGMALAAVFHYAMAVNAHAAFSALAMAWYVALMPAEVVTAMDRRVRHGGPWRLALAAIAVVGTAIVVLGTLLNLADVDVGSSLSARMPFVVLAPGVVALIALSWRDVSGTTLASPRPDRPTLVGAGIGVAVLLAATALPYLGVRTQGTLSMFSNLRTEATAGYWNHYLVPESVNVVSSNDTWVELVGDSPLRFRSLELDKPAKAVNLFEVRRELADVCGGRDVVPLSYREVGTSQVVSLDDACHSDLAQPIPLWERKMIWFRPILDPNACTH